MAVYRSRAAARAAGRALTRRQVAAVGNVLFITASIAAIAVLLFPRQILGWFS